MIPGFHGFDLIVILIIALLIFGPKRLPEMGSSIGKSIKEFRKGMSELTSPKEEKVDEPMTPIAARDMDKLNSSSSIDAELRRANSVEASKAPSVDPEPRVD